VPLSNKQPNQNVSQGSDNSESSREDAKPDKGEASRYKAKITSIPAAIGNWRIEKDVDQMTDKASCTAYYHRDSQIQLNEQGFYISLRGRGGVKGITLRFDEKPARELRLATDIERRIGAVNFNRAEFNELQSSKRLRVRVMTILDQIYQDDIDLSGHLDALEVLRSPRCKGNAR